ncbi:hypothetical protein F5Y05DRAFT_413770 [Hypoxylon sp. FL0543]|nr:hypothetical protein F5Y05DRAFT_413770 [Hypoxylon sp. FL0543]
MSALLLLLLALLVDCHHHHEPANSLTMLNRTASSKALGPSIRPIWRNSTTPVPTTRLTVISAECLSGFDQGTEVAGISSMNTTSSINLTGMPRWSNTSGSTIQLPVSTTPKLLATSYPTDEDSSMPTAVTVWPNTDSVGIPETLSWSLGDVHNTQGSSTTSPAIAFTQSSGRLYDSTSTITTTEPLASTGRNRGEQPLADDTSLLSTPPLPLTVIEVSSITSTITATVTDGGLTVRPMTATSLDYSDLQLETTSPTTTATDTVKVRPPI